MNSSQIISELDRTRSLCEQVDSLFQSANAMGRMMSISETVQADRLSQELVKQIRRLPRKLGLEESAPGVRAQAGETLELLRVTLRRIAAPAKRTAGRCSKGLRNMSAYNV